MFYFEDENEKSSIEVAYDELLLLGELYEEDIEEDCEEDEDFE